MTPTPQPGDESATMPLLAHLGELRRCLLRAGLGIVIAFAACYWQVDRIMAWCEAPYRAVVDQPLVVLSITEAFFVKIRVAFLAALFLSAPVTLWQAWAFIRPGLLPAERRLAVPFVALTSVFFILGGLFGHAFGMPAILRFLLVDAATGFETSIRAEGYVQSLSRVLIGMGLVFEAPVLTYFLARLGLVTASGLVRRLRLAVIVIAILAALITPSGDIPTMIVFALPMLALYGLGIGVAWVAAPRRPAAARSPAP